MLGRRVRHHRRRQGLTLEALGARIGKPAPYLSLLENGKRGPRLSLVFDLAAALGVDVGELLDPEPGTRRDALEIELLKAQEGSLFESLDLPPVKPTARLDTETLTHLVGLHRALAERSRLDSAASDEVRRANVAVSSWVTASDGYLADVESAAHTALAASGYDGGGSFNSRHLLDLAKAAGYAIEAIEDMPSFARSIIDTRNKRIYIAQRDELRTRQARKAVLQTLAAFLLDHQEPADVENFLRQRVETAYFAAAVLVPESSVVPRLEEAKRLHDLDVEDVKESFYVSYEMAAWRLANLSTRHLGIRNHIIVSDHRGRIIKGFANDGVPVPRDEAGGMEARTLCRWWGARWAFDSADRYSVHHQYTDTPVGTFFCTTQVDAGREQPHAVTLGVGFDEARWFRGRDTENRMRSRCPEPDCCRIPPPDLASKWDGSVIVSARSQERLLGLLAPDPYPELDLPRAYEVVEAHSGQ